MDDLRFRISSALKNLIGKELITDEIVAVFELVKNSFDAHATNVKVIFENQYVSDKAKIIIVDNGKGMSLSDIREKWLFVGYSAKKDGSEDRDYRNNFRNKRVFTGAKGVGRFSCDRLGEHLELYTKNQNGSIENLSINWAEFEEDAKKEFIDIIVKHQTVDNIPYSPFISGTILELSKLRDVWDRQRILLLKSSLEKLINPNQENGDADFQIEIVASDEIIKDEQEESSHRKVNGPIHNFVFERLGLKTTYIKVDITDGGDIIKTSLTDRGREIYWVKEKNSYSLLRDISVTLFQLNRSAKYSFTKQMQVEPVKYGSVFMYKNGFRIYPFGEEGDDSLGIDRRKQQGYNRFLGTRDLIGRIEVSGDIVNLVETTSRDGGFIKNDTYKQLIDFFYDKVLRRLERYVVDVIKWGDVRTNKETGEVAPELNPEDVKAEILEIISNLTKTNDIIDVGYDSSFLEVYKEAQSRSVQSIAQNILRAAERTNDQEVIRQAQAQVVEIERLISAKKEAEGEVEQVREEKTAIEQDLQRKTKQVLFLQSIDNLDIDRIIHYHHDIGVHADTIQNWVDDLSKKISRGQDISINELKVAIDGITIANKKILAISHYATKANFNTSGDLLSADIVAYISQYVSEILPEFYPEILFHVEGNDKSYSMSFKPLEVSLLLDNLVSNSFKAKSHNFTVRFEWNDSKLSIDFIDDGKGLSDLISHPDMVFEKGVTTTSGSGLGLFNIKEFVTKEMGGTVRAYSAPNKGFVVSIAF